VRVVGENEQWSELRRKEQVPWRKVLAWTGLAVATVVVVAAALYVVFWPLSDLIARHDVGSITGPARAAALQTARDAARGRLVAFGAGLFAVGALVYTARNFSLSRQGQVTDRYTKAIEQLGSGKLDVRIGGIYALERVARDSPRDHPTIMEVLAAFIREHSHEHPPPLEGHTAPPSRDARPDVQAAATVIGRRTTRHDSQFLNLVGANLTGAKLSVADLPTALLMGANLTGANLVDANLTGAYLNGANLTTALLYGANLTGANLTGANLTGANLAYANLTRANLTRADLTRANLISANLKGADLTRATLTGAYLDGAHWPSDTPVPPGWQRGTDSGCLWRAAGDSGDAAE
jgi:hypothetical protein